MDVINPGITVIGKRYYRNCLTSTNNEEITNEDYIYNKNYDEDYCDYDETNSYFFIKEEGNNFVTHLKVATMFYGFIIGKKGECKKKIECDTKTNITIPYEGKTGPVVVKGKSYASVDRAASRICELVELGRYLTPFTHFFSIPANNEIITQSFEKFKSEVLHFCLGDRGIEDRLFQKPYKLHLTLSLVVIGDHDELDSLLKIFNEFKQSNEELFRESLRVHIKGLEYMNDDPCEVRVLYGKVANELDSEKLQILANKLVAFLAEKRLISQKYSNVVTLHMTLLNASFLSEQDLALDTANDAKNPKHFDCSNILKKFSDWDFGFLDVNEIILSKRHGTSQGSYYAKAATFKLGPE